MRSISEILDGPTKPALFIGNGINQYSGDDNSSWTNLLKDLAQRYDLNLSAQEMNEVSNTEFFDILDLSKPNENRKRLQKQFCELMTSWEPSLHHKSIVSWAQRHQTPIITVNFDENFSKASNIPFNVGNRFTDWYPWHSYFSCNKIDNPRENFAIWHPHGMMRYSRSIRLGLRDYMGAVHRARAWIYRGDESLARMAKSEKGKAWSGQGSWLEIIFFCPIMIFGFGFHKDESFLRWLFLERARFHKMYPNWERKAWFIDTPSSTSKLSRKPFFDALGIEYISVNDYSEIYENPSWQK
jgi:hypothetical protein